MDLFIDQHRLRFSIAPELLSTQKSTIIFLHDSLGCIELWRNFPYQIEASTGFQVLSYDRQGYGKSAPFSIIKRSIDYLEKEAIILGKIIQKLNLSDVILFGHSDGGSIALLTAALFPDSIKAIITEGAHVFVEPETIEGIKKAVVAYKTTNLREKLIRYHGTNTEGVFLMWTETWLSKEFQSWNIEDYLPKIQCPSLIIQGEKDEFGTIDQVHSIVNNTSGNSIPFLIPNTGHTPHKETPDLVINQTQAFLNNFN